MNDDKIEISGDELEGTFHNSIQMYLAIFGHNELKAEMERMRREELN